MTKKYALNFIETMQRLVRNLLNDDQALDAVRHAWSTLYRFLDPARFPPDSLLRHAVFVSCAEVVRQGRSSLEAKLVNRFADRVDVADLQAESEGPLWRQSCIALVHLYDWQVSKGRLRVGEADSLFASLTRFRDRSEKFTPPLVVAASEGCLDAAKAINLHFAEDVNVSQLDGWTALMIAASRGHKLIVEWLLELGAQVTPACVETGWTAVIAAAAGGHTEALALLLDNDAKVNRGAMDDG